MTGQGKELIFWIGPLCDEAELEGMIQRRECATASANLAEWNYLKYFAQMYDVPIVVWSALRTIEYPKNSRFSYPSRRVEYFWTIGLSCIMWAIATCSASAIYHENIRLFVLQKTMRGNWMRAHSFSCLCTACTCHL